MPARELKYYKELDGLRGLAALMVFFFHITLGRSVWWVQKLSFFGQTGVNLFFVLSGFLITRILLASKGEKGYYFNFYARRSLRIFPLYYFVLIAVFIVIPLVKQSHMPPFSTQVWYWVYLQNIGMSFGLERGDLQHFWSLAVEEHFYLFWPVVAAITTHKQLIKVSIGLIIVAITTRLILAPNILAMHFFTPACFDSLAMGCILGIMEYRGLHTKYGYIARYLFLSMSIITCIVWVPFHYNDPGIMHIRPVVINLLYFSAIWCLLLVRETNFIGRFFRSRPLTFSGKISYGIYVYHPLCLLYIARQFPAMPQYLKLCAALAAMYIIATLSYYGFERRFTRMRKYFR